MGRSVKDYEDYDKRRFERNVNEDGEGYKAPPGFWKNKKKLNALLSAQEYMHSEFDDNFGFNPHNQQIENYIGENLAEIELYCKSIRRQQNNE